jgi:hypothetical protein
VPVPPFAELFTKRLRIIGRTLLVRETDAQNRLVLRLYDVATGQDLWKKSYPANSRVVRCEEPDLASVIEPSGVVTVTDLRTRQDVLKTTVDKDHMEKVNDAYLISDREMFYLALNKPIDPLLIQSGPQQNLTNGLRSVPVNGTFYALNRKLEKVAWYDTIANQMLVLDQFQEMPIVFFTARYQKLIGGPIGMRRGSAQVVAVKCIDKRAGKALFDKPDMPTDRQPFHAVHIDYPKRTIEWVAGNFKIRFYMEDIEK